MPTPHHPPAAVRCTLRKLGSDIHDARRRRKLPMAVVAERAFTSRSTLQRIEAGDPSVSMGIYAAVLQSLGLLDGLGNVADIAQDEVGQALASASLPKRVRLKAKTAARKPRVDDLGAGKAESVRDD
ncbi:MAG: transcriptional regulator with XRE-family HTH domain [Rhodothermales bacterium]|jgi:transcriptional regulator with XRE-family HTH domain